MDRVNKRITLLRKIDKAWDEKRNLYGVKYDIDKGYFAYRNAIMRMLAY